MKEKPLLKLIRMEEDAESIYEKLSNNGYDLRNILTFTDLLRNVAKQKEKEKKIHGYVERFRGSLPS